VNASLLPTFLAIPMTGNLRLGELVTNLVLTISETGLSRDSVAQPTLLLAVDEGQFMEQIGILGGNSLERLFAKLNLVLGRA
jgi:hypothetical protein